MTHTSIQHRFFLLFLVLCLSVSLHAQEPVQLEPGKAIERELAGDQSHTYQIPLTAGQFVRFRLDQRAIDVAMILSAPEGKQLVEMNLSGPGGQEALFLEAAVTGSYRLVVRGSGGAMVRGGYRLETAVQATATALDRQRLTAQSLLIEANLLRAQGAKTAQQVIEKMQQARPLLGEIGETGWTAISLLLTGQAYGALSQPAKAIEYFEQALPLSRELKDRRGETTVLMGLGASAYALSRGEKTVEYNEQALVIARELKDRTGEARALNGLANGYWLLRRYDKDLEYRVQALAIHRELKDRRMEAVELNNLGNPYGALGQPEKALEVREQALAIYRELKDRRGEANVLMGLGASAYALSRGEKTVEYTEQALVIARELKDRAGEAAALNGLCSGYFLLRRYDKNLEYRVQELAIHRELKDRRNEAVALDLLGNPYGALGQPEKALEVREQALAIYRELKDRRGEANVLMRLGASAYALSRGEKTVEYYEQALVIARELKDRAGEAAALNGLCTGYFLLRRYDKNLEYRVQELAIHRELKDRRNEAVALNNLGNPYVGLGQPEKALEVRTQALAIYRELKDRTGEAGTLDLLGNPYFALGQPEKAFEVRTQALAIYRELKDRAGEAHTLMALGLAHFVLGRYEKTKEYYEQALAIFREMKNRKGEADALFGLSNGYWGLSQYEKDIEHREQALAICREMKNRICEADMLSMLGNAYGALSRYEKSIEYFEQALAIFREMKNRAGEGYVLGLLGGAYGALSRYEKSIEYNEKSLAISREIKSRSIELQSLNYLGVYYESLSRHEQAIEQFEKALAISRKTSEPYIEGGALSSLGDAYKSLSRYEQAIQAYEQALAIYSKIKNLQGEGYVRSALGDAYTRLSRYEQSIAHLDLALLRLREARDRAGEAEALYHLARAERGQSRLVAARTHIEESLKIGESLRTEQIISPESRAAFLANTQNRYQFYTDLLMLQHRAEPTKGFDALALEVSERQRARSLLDLLTEARAEVRQGVDAALLERERSLGRQLKDKAQRLLKANTPEQSAALKKEISQLENDYERAQVEIRKANPHYAALVQPQPLKFAELQQQLDADTLLLEYALGEEHSYVWAITRDSLKSYELPQGKEIEKTARQVHELLAARSTNKRGESAVQRRDRIAQAEAQLPAAAAVLSQMVLSPVAAELGNKRLVIVPDGALQYVPFAMLPQPSVVSGQLSVATNNGQRTTDNRQPLIVTHEIISLPSASALAVQRKELAGRQPAPKMLAVIADPVFTNTDERRKSADKPAIAEPSSGLADTRIIEQLAGESAGKGQLVIPRLPYTRQEAEQILALVPNAANLKAIDFKANYAITTSGELAQYRYLHFATHGLLDAERPGLSALVLSLVDEQGKPQDGFLRTNDIINLNLPAELVVLSACQTGLGQEIKGEGLVGITRGFMYAGAARVVVSLWSVNDRATAELMTKFYQKMLKAGQSPAAALRAAQVEMWKQKQWQAPYYWAAFVLQGEWK